VSEKARRRCVRHHHALREKMASSGDGVGMEGMDGRSAGPGRCFSHHRGATSVGCAGTRVSEQALTSRRKNHHALRL
jgi:hypothetical protein